MIPKNTTKTKLEATTCAHTMCTQTESNVTGELLQNFVVIYPEVPTVSSQKDQEPSGRRRWV